MNLWKLLEWPWSLITATLIVFIICTVIASVVRWRGRQFMAAAGAAAGGGGGAGGTGSGQPPTPVATPQSSPPANQLTEIPEPEFPIKPPVTFGWRLLFAFFVWATLLGVGWLLGYQLLGIIGFSGTLRLSISYPLGLLLGGLFIFWSLRLFFPFRVPELTVYITVNNLWKERVADGTSRGWMYVYGPGLAFTLPWESFSEKIPVIRIIGELKENVSAKEGGVFQIVGNYVFIASSAIENLVKYVQAIKEQGVNGIKDTIVSAVRGLVTDTVAPKNIDEVLSERGAMVAKILEEFKNRKSDIEKEFGIDITIVKFDIDPSKEVLDIQNKAYEMGKVTERAKAFGEVDASAREDTLIYLDRVKKARQIAEHQVSLRLDTAGLDPDIKRAVASVLTEAAKNPALATAVAAAAASFAGGKAGTVGKSGQKPPEGTSK